jgi:hypothetical protein
MLENLFFCSSFEQLGQLALKDEFHSKEVSTVCTEEVDTVDEETEDEGASQCNESDTVAAPVSICSGMLAVVRAFMLVYKNNL